MEVGKLVWAKQKGFPAWPALTYARRGKSTCEKKRDEKVEIFVMFLQELPTTAYVDQSQVKPFEPAKIREYLDVNGEFFTRFPGWFDAVQYGLDVLAPIDSPAERITRIEEKLAEDAEKNPTGVRKTDELQKRFGPTFFVKKKKTFGHYCTCKEIIEEKSGKTGKNSTMVRCCVCFNFYHLSCLRMSGLPRNSDCWVCDNCGENIGRTAKRTKPAKIQVSPELLPDLMIQKLSISDEIPIGSNNMNDSISGDETLSQLVEKSMEQKMKQPKESKPPGRSTLTWNRIRTSPDNSKDKENDQVKDSFQLDRSIHPERIVPFRKTLVRCTRHQSERAESKKRIPLVERRQMMGGEEEESVANIFTPPAGCDDCKLAQLRDYQRQCATVNEDLICEDLL